MGVFSFLGSTLAKPYTRLGRDVTKSAMNIRSSLEKLKVGENEQDDQTEFVDAPDGKAAFELLYEKNGWTASQLEVQQRVVTRAKWFFMAGTALSILLFFAFGFLSSHPLFMVVSVCFTMLTTAIFGVRTIQYAIFQTQLQERELMGFFPFMGRPDFWKRLFS